MKPAEQPPIRTAASNSPPPSRLQRVSGATWRPCARSQAGSSSRICWGVHFPSMAMAAPEAVSRMKTKARLRLFMAGECIAGRPLIASRRDTKSHRSRMNTFPGRTNPPRRRMKTFPGRTNTSQPRMNASLGGMNTPGARMSVPRPRTNVSPGRMNAPQPRKSVHPTSTNAPRPAANASPVRMNGPRPKKSVPPARASIPQPGLNALWWRSNAQPSPWRAPPAGRQALRAAKRVALQAAHRLRRDGLHAELRFGALLTSRRGEAHHAELNRSTVQSKGDRDEQEDSQEAGPVYGDAQESRRAKP